MGKFGASRHVVFYISILLGLAAGTVALFIDAAIALPIGANLFFLSYVGLTARASRKFTSDFLRKHASDEDEPAPFILLVMLAAVTAAAVSLFLVVMDSSNRLPLRLPLGVASVVLGWFAVHTMWAVHYAYEYYKAMPAAAAAGKTKSGKIRQGLEFPGGEDPNGVAFVYFAYVIGMTAQTADTNITSNAMRQIVIVHGVFSFFFNTVIVAAAVNIAVALAH
ncbi:MAG: DUF1345 domain-containing protein [Devosia sp.]